MKIMNKFMKSLKCLSKEWYEGVCKDLDDLGFSYDKNRIKKHYKDRILESNYTPGESIKKELEYLKQMNLIKPNLKVLFINNKKKSDNITFELHKNKHLLLLNGSMLELSYKECEEISEKRKNKDYHFEFLLEDLYLQMFYEDRKLSEIGDRILLLSDRKQLLEKLLNLKNTNNSIIDSYLEEFRKATDSQDLVYQYEIEASNLLNEKKYSDEEIFNDREDLETTSLEYKTSLESREEELNIIRLLKEKIDRIESIVDLTSTTEETTEEKINKLENIRKIYSDTLELESSKNEKKKKELSKVLSQKKGL